MPNEMKSVVSHRHRFTGEPCIPLLLNDRIVARPSGSDERLDAVQKSVCHKSPPKGLKAYFYSGFHRKLIKDPVARSTPR